MTSNHPATTEGPATSRAWPRDTGQQPGLRRSRNPARAERRAGNPSGPPHATHPVRSLSAPRLGIAGTLQRAATPAGAGTALPALRTTSQERATITAPGSPENTER